MDGLTSIIIPTLNEERGIEATLDSAAAQSEPHEIIVVDGGSDDGTRRIAARFAQTITTPAGRARQMNAGAARARGDVLLFLHADTLLPPCALSAVRQALEPSGMEGGAFRLQFDEPTPLLRVYALFARLPLPSICFGDRALFVRRGVFEEVGGYPNVPLFEDLELVRKLYDRGGFAFLKVSVVTSARRFRKTGPLLQQLRNTYLWLHYVAGADLRRLVDIYPYR